VNLAFVQVPMAKLYLFISVSVGILEYDHEFNVECQSSCFLPTGATAFHQDNMQLDTCGIHKTLRIPDDIS
jgi:hypothetical protein